MTDIFYHEIKRTKDFFLVVKHLNELGSCCRVSHYIDSVSTLPLLLLYGSFSIGMTEQTPQEYFDGRSSSIVSGDVKFTKSGDVDGRSAAVRSGELTLNQDGQPRANAKAINQRDLNVKPSNIPENSERTAFTGSQKDAAWEKADTIPGTNPDFYREDCAGNALNKGSYGQYTDMGWQVDHSRPLNKGGQMDHPNNHQVLQSRQNASKGNKPAGEYFASAEQMGISAVHAEDVDYRSSAVKSGDLTFKPNGTVDGRSEAVRNGDVIVTQSGGVDGRSAAVKQGDVLQR
jgi:hypothetical protein